MWKLPNWYLKQKKKRNINYDPQGIEIKLLVSIAEVSISFIPFYYKQMLQTSVAHSGLDSVHRNGFKEMTSLIYLFNKQSWRVHTVVDIDEDCVLDCPSTPIPVLDSLILVMDLRARWSSSKKKGLKKKLWNSIKHKFIGTITSSNTSTISHQPEITKVK